MKGYVLEYVNENEFKKLERALKKYNMLAFKKLNFDYYPSLRNGNFVGEKVSVNKENGTESYELRLPSDKMFAQIHGEVVLKYTVHKKEGTVVLETITPTEILLEGHRSELTTYKGIMISKANASKDKFKIDLLSRMQIFIVFALLLALVGGATYAYFTAQGGGTSQANVNVLTHTTDSLIFETGVPISFYADQENFAQGKPNRFGSTIARATAKAGSATEKFVGKYNIFFVIEDNDFEYTTTEKTAELILTIKDPTGAEVTSLPNLTHTTVKGVSGFDITMKKGAFAIVKEQVIEALTSQTTVQEWEITVTLVNLDSNQNANTKKTFNAQLYVTKEDMESYALPVVNTIETTVGGSGTELQVKAKTGASTAEVKKYYYKIDEITSTSQLKVKALKVTPLAIGT